MLSASAKSPARSRLLLALSLLTVGFAITIINSLCTTISNERLLPTQRSYYLVVFALAALTSTSAFLLDLVAYPLLWSAAPTRPLPFLPLLRVGIALLLAAVLIPEGVDALCDCILAAAVIANNLQLFHYTFQTSRYVQDVGSIGSLLFVPLAAGYFIDLARRLHAPLLLVPTLILFALDFLYALIYFFLSAVEFFTPPDTFNALYYLLEANPLLYLAAIAYMLTLITLLVRRPLDNPHTVSSPPAPHQPTNLIRSQ